MNRRQLFCTDCAENYNSLEDLEAHIAGDHLNICPYECEKCKYAKFPTEFTLVSHCVNDHGLNEFSIKYRYTTELNMKKKELTDKIHGCLIYSRRMRNGDERRLDPVSSTVEHQNLQKIKLEDSESFINPLQTSSPMVYMDTLAMSSYHAFLDETLSRHEEEKSGPSGEGSEDGKSNGGPIKVKQQIQCSLCGDVVSKQRSSMVYHANTRHGKYELYECGICHRKWQTIAKSDVIKHIKSHHEHELPDGTVNVDMVIDYRKNLGNKLKAVTEQCFPERKRRRIGYTDNTI